MAFFFSRRRFEKVMRFLIGIKRSDFARVPPSPRSLRIKDLGRKSCQVFEFKWLAGKVFIKHRLRTQKQLKMALGQFRGPFWKTDTPLNCPNQNDMVARDAGLSQGISFSRAGSLSCYTCISRGFHARYPSSRKHRKALGASRQAYRPHQNLLCPRGDHRTLG